MPSNTSVDYFQRMKVCQAPQNALSDLTKDLLSYNTTIFSCLLIHTIEATPLTVFHSYGDCDGNRLAETAIMPTNPVRFTSFIELHFSEELFL